MAKLFKLKNSPYWYYRVHVNGVDRWKSTKQADKKKAQAIADGHRAATTGTLNAEALFGMLIAKLDSLPPEEKTERRMEYGRRLMLMQSDRLAFGDAWERWLAMPNKSRFGTPKPNTLAGYSAIWKRFAKWAGAQELTYLHEVDKKRGQNYMGDVLGSGVTERTYGAHLKFLRSLFTVLKDQAGIVENPFDGLTVPELQTQSREAFTAQELATICAGAAGDWRYLVGIGIYTGLRLTDAAHLKWENIGDRITVQPAKVARRKKDGTVEIPIHPVLAGLLAELREVRGGADKGHLFPDFVKAYKADRASVSAAFGALLTTLGIVTTAEEAGIQRKRRAALRGFHSLRHSFVSLCAMNGVPQATTQKLVGHSSAEMTQLYSHGDRAGEESSIRLLPALTFGAI